MRHFGLPVDLTVLYYEMSCMHNLTPGWKYSNSSSVAI